MHPTQLFPTTSNIEKPPKLRHKKDEPRQPCAVCADVSSGYHYDVPSCNGCRSFFRRTITNNRLFICRKGNNCKIGRIMRCTCRACRFRKCVEAGMNPQMIVYADKEEQPSAPETSPSPSSSSEEASKIASQKLPIISPLFQYAFNLSEEKKGLLDYLMCIEESVENLRLSLDNAPTIILDVLTRPSALKKPVQSQSLMTTATFNMDKEVYVSLEYLKSFPWFCHLSFTDKYTLLGDRLAPFLALRLAWYQAIRSPTNHVLFPLVDWIQKMNMNKASLALLGVICLTDCSVYITDHRSLKEEKQKYTASLAGYLMYKYGCFTGKRLSEHLFLLWTTSSVGNSLKKYLRATEPKNSLSRQIFDNSLP